MIYIAAHALYDPSVAPKERGARSLAEVLRAFADVAPFFVLIAGTLGGLYFGVVTTTEAAVIGCFLSLLLGFVFGDLTMGARRRGDALDGEFLRQHPVPDLRRVCLLLCDQRSRASARSSPS